MLIKGDAKKVLELGLPLISSEILREAAEKILFEMDKSDEKILLLERNLKTANKKIAELDKKIFDLEKDYFCVENLPDEIWKDVEGYEGIYQISNKGRIKSFHYGRAHLMRGGGGKSGYRTVVLNKDGRSRTKLLHVLIAKTFIPNPEKKPFVNHKDGDKLNNCVENLEWVTAKENTRHAIENGLIKRNYGTDHQMSKFSDEDIKFIFSVFKKGDRNFGINALAKKFGVNKSTIERIIKGKTYSDKN